MQIGEVVAEIVQRRSSPPREGDVPLRDVAGIAAGAPVEVRNRRPLDPTWRDARSPARSRSSTTKSSRSRKRSMSSPNWTIAAALREGFDCHDAHPQGERPRRCSPHGGVAGVCNAAVALNTARLEVIDEVLPSPSDVSCRRLAAGGAAGGVSPSPAAAAFSPLLLPSAAPNQTKSLPPKWAQPSAGAETVRASRQVLVLRRRPARVLPAASRSGLAPRPLPRLPPPPNKSPRRPDELLARRRRTPHAVRLRPPARRAPP